MGNLHAFVTISLLYNIHYNISVVASLCGQAIAENSVGLFYSKWSTLILAPSSKLIVIFFIVDSCENPSTDFLIIMGYTIPAREGTNITFNCSSGLEQLLVGPNTSTCMGNGKWEPDPKEVECRGIIQFRLQDLQT